MTHATSAGFAHRRLDVYRVALELTLGVERLATGLPRGHAGLKDQVRRAASATTRNLSEGANCWSARDKAARYVIARGECGECDAALEMIQRLGLCAASHVRSLRRLTDRVGAMLTALIRYQQARSGEIGE
jgi:four helix bundle protein